MNISVIDIGSNTVKATVFKISNKSRLVVGYKGIKAKLISYIEICSGKRYLSENGVRLLYDSIGELITFSEGYSCDSVFAFATASLRNTENSKEILTNIYNTYSLNVTILSGEEEALYSLKGLLNDELCSGIPEGVMIDMGGGSTEIVHFVNGRNPEIFSLPFGCLSLYNDYVKGSVPTRDEEKRIEQYVTKEMENCLFVKNIGVPVFFIGGSGRAIYKLIDKKIKENQLRADGTDFITVLNKFKDEEFFFAAEKLVPGRTTTVCPASIAYRTIVNFISATSIFVSDSGVREGYLEKILP